MFFYSSANTNLRRFSPFSIRIPGFMKTLAALSTIIGLTCSVNEHPWAYIFASLAGLAGGRKGGGRPVLALSWFTLAV